MARKKTNNQKIKKSSDVVRHFIDLHALDAKTLRKILDNAHAMKKAGKRTPARLRPKNIDKATLVMVFEKPSTRTRVSFDVGMTQLGGHVINMNHTDLQLGRGESTVDTARVLSRYADAIMIRANSHQTLLELSEHASIPVINGLTDESHPCQVMADLMTFEEHLGNIEGKTVAWLGDGNNVAVSWMHAAQRFNFTLRIGCPAELKPPKSEIDWVRKNGGDIIVTSDPIKAASKADCVVTDTWVSMGDKGAVRRKKLLRPYTVDAGLMARAHKDAIFMHCLPAYRGDEVSAEVIDGPQSVVFDEAENRLHAQKAILAWCLGA